MKTLFKIAKYLLGAAAVIVVLLTAAYFYIFGSPFSSKETRTVTETITRPAANKNLSAHTLSGSIDTAPYDEPPTAVAGINKHVTPIKRKISRELMLMGTIVPGYAVFEDTKIKKQAVFKVGSEVFMTGTLTEVRDKSATLRIGDREVIYDLAKKNLDYNANAEIDRVVRSARRSAARAIAVPEPPRTKTRVSIAKQTGKNNWEFREDAVRRIASNIDTVLSDALLTEMPETAAGSGYRVSEVTSGGVFEQGGLKEGDVIQRVNGLDVTSKMNWAIMLAQLRVQSSFAVEVLRKGRPVTLHYKIR
ncbi:MAG: PDZ domain-containing protein [Thermodesulfobacteriota bacterium]